MLALGFGGLRPIVHVLQVWLVRVCQQGHLHPPDSHETLNFETLSPTTIVFQHVHDSSRLSMRLQDLGVPLFEMRG